MVSYWHKHPRGFANECDIVRCDSPFHKPYLEDAGYTRITRNDLIKHIRWLNAENAAWGSNTAFSPITLDHVFHDYAYSSTLWMRHHEEEQESPL